MIAYTIYSVVSYFVSYFTRLFILSQRSQLYEGFTLYEYFIRRFKLSAITSTVRAEVAECVADNSSSWALISKDMDMGHHGAELLQGGWKQKIQHS